MFRFLLAVFFLINFSLHAWRYSCRYGCGTNRSYDVYEIGETLLSCLEDLSFLPKNSPPKRCSGRNFTTPDNPWALANPWSVRVCIQYTPYSKRINYNYDDLPYEISIDYTERNLEDKITKENCCSTELENYLDTSHLLSHIKEIIENIFQMQKTLSLDYIKEEQECLSRHYTQEYPWMVLNYEKEVSKALKRIEQAKQKLHDRQQMLACCREKIQNIYRKDYQWCLEHHKWAGSHYLMGLMHFENAEFMEALDSISKLFQSSTNPPEEAYLTRGIVQSELGLYNEAIVSLSKLLEKSPKRKDAYFERAVAYFETGNYEKAIADYLSSEKTFALTDQLEFALGLTEGLKRGSTDALQLFIPSILTSLRGLSHGLWAFVTEPAEVSQQMVTACQAVIDFLTMHSSLETLQTLFPETKELTDDPDNLPLKRKGEIIGQLVGKHGTDFVLCCGLGKGIKAYTDLKKANAALSLEKLAGSTSLSGQLTHLSDSWSSKTAPIIEEMQLNGGRLGDKLYKAFRGQELSELQVRKILHHTGFQTFPKPSGIPANSPVHISKKGGGMTYHKSGTDGRQSVIIRVMPGNPGSPRPMQRNPYVIQRRGKDAVAKNGQIVDRASPEAHIPLEEFEFKEW